jgi:hypothetical protein
MHHVISSIALRITFPSHTRCPLSFSPWTGSSTSTPTSILSYRILIPHYPAHSPSSRSTCHRNLRSCSIWYSLVYLQIAGQMNFLKYHWQSGHPLGSPSAWGVEKESAYFEMSSFIMEANPSVSRLFHICAYLFTSLSFVLPIRLPSPRAESHSRTCRQLGRCTL